VTVAGVAEDRQIGLGDVGELGSEFLFGGGGR
jgi:hypothetical protein